MDSNSGKRGDINFGNVHGNVILSQEQSGGTTVHNINSRSNEKASKKKTVKNRLLWIFTFLGGLASVVTVLAYFEVYPFKQNHKQAIPQSDSIKTTIAPQINRTYDSAVPRQIINFPKQSKKMNTKQDKNMNGNISVGNVTGDVIISQGQTGGITAHTINIGEPALPARHLSDEDKMELIAFTNRPVALTTSMADNEAKEYGQEICDYLISIGCTVSRTVYNVGFGNSSEKSRFSINENSIYVPVNKK